MGTILSDRREADSDTRTVRQREGGPDRTSFPSAQNQIEEVRQLSALRDVCRVRVDGMLGVVKLGVVKLGVVKLGVVRVSRVMGAVAAGRVLNRKTARSQVVGGTVFGVGMALHEASMMDGQGLGMKGLGVKGVLASPGAIANAGWHATGRGVRDLPITMDKVLGDTVSGL